MKENDIHPTKSSVFPQKMKWYLQRLASMSLPEIGYRLRQQIRTGFDRITYNKRGKLTRTNYLPEGAWQSFRNQEHARFYFDWPERQMLIDRYREAFPQAAANTIRVAEELLRSKIHLFSQEFDLGEKIDWHTDPLTRRRWPLAYWADIDTRDGFTIGGIKWIWELNRHHHLVTLGKAYFLTRDERYAAEVCSQLASWVYSNPPYQGVNWSSPLEMAVRLINWCWALAFIRDSSSLTQELFSIISYSAGEQANFITKYLSGHSSANNHLIGEAAGLAIAGYFFTWLPEALDWRQRGYAILEKEIIRQISPQGVPREQSFHYLIFILDLNLFAWRLAEINRFTVPAAWKERLKAACEFMRHLMDSQGNLPNIGDSDDACVVRLSDNSLFNNYQSILASAAVMFKNAEFKASASGWDEKSHWLFGPEGERFFNSLSSSQTSPKSWYIHDSGYSVMRSQDRVIMMDSGPLGYLSTAAHGHADALSLNVSSQGEPLLIDPGTYLYQEGGPWRRYFRGTSAHNTVVVGGQDQSEMQGTFLWGRKANAYLERWITNDEYDIAIAYHDGYRHLGLIHRRAVLFCKPDLVLVKDSLEGKGRHQFSQLWHLPAHASVAQGSPAIKITVNQVNAYIIPLHENLTSFECIRGEQEPIQGWVSPHYGAIEPAPVIAFSGAAGLPVRLFTALYLPEGSSAADHSSLLDRIQTCRSLLEVSL